MPLCASETNVPGLHTKHSASHSSLPFLKHGSLFCISAVNLHFRLGILTRTSNSCNDEVTRPQTVIQTDPYQSWWKTGARARRQVRRRWEGCDHRLHTGLIHVRVFTETKLKQLPLGEPPSLSHHFNARKFNKCDFLTVSNDGRWNSGHLRDFQKSPRTQISLSDFRICPGKSGRMATLGYAHILTPAATSQVCLFM